MALPPTEIRYSKKAAYFIVAVTIIIFVPMAFSFSIVSRPWQMYLGYILAASDDK